MVTLIKIVLKLYYLVVRRPLKTGIWLETTFLHVEHDLNVQPQTINNIVRKITVIHFS